MWVKGNLHCHTTSSDGDSEPDEVCRYYADHGYDFLSITDHMAFVDPETVESHGLLLVPGEELHLSAEEDPDAPLHVNGFGLSKRVAADGSNTKAESIQNCIDAITADGGIAQINHPNFHYAFDHGTIEQTTDCALLEVYNGHPQVHNEGDDSHIGVERMWDHLLSSGRRFYATAVDDAHHFHGFGPERANPRRGWIWARVSKLNVEEILGALRGGDFYASTGIEMEDVGTGGGVLRVVVRPQAGKTYKTRFIGNDGVTLLESESCDSVFRLDGMGGSYVRAKVICSDGACAWTQPVFV